MQQYLLAAATYGEETSGQLAPSPWLPYVVGGMAVLIVFALVVLFVAVWSVKADLRDLTRKLDESHRASQEGCNECREKFWVEINKLRDRLTILEAGGKAKVRCE
jgi:hypothetical protein